MANHGGYDLARHAGRGLGSHHGVNLRGVFLATKFAVPHMLKRGSGAIFNVSSIHAQVPDYFEWWLHHADMAAAVRMSIDERKVADKRIDKTITLPANVGETFDVGLDRGVTVSDRLPRDGKLEADVAKLTVHFAPSGEVPQ